MEEMRNLSTFMYYACQQPNDSHSFIFSQSHSRERKKKMEHKRKRIPMRLPYRYCHQVAPAIHHCALCQIFPASIDNLSDSLHFPGATREIREKRIILIHISPKSFQSTKVLYQYQWSRVLFFDKPPTFFREVFHSMEFLAVVVVGWTHVAFFLDPRSHGCSTHL